MTANGMRILFWCLIAVQFAGSQAILWNGIPIHRRLLSSGTEGAGSMNFVFAAIVVIDMQVAHWVAFRLRPQLRFRLNVFLGNVLLFIGETSMFFISALAVVVLFDRGADLDFVLWKVLILVAILFAVFSYKNQLSKLGDSIIEGQPKAAAEWSSNANR
jgi:hypothetical protein